MNKTDSDPFQSLDEVLQFVGLTSGLQINETLLLPKSESLWSSILIILPLILGCIGLIVNGLALILFSTSKTFLKSSFRYYIYAFVLVNCASILTHSWVYLLFYYVDPIRLCKYLQYIQQSSSSSSWWIMVLLSFERSLNFTRPFTMKRFLQSRRICWVLIALTALCFLLHLDELLTIDIKAYRWVNFAYGICSIKRYSLLATDRIKLFRHAHSFILPFLFNLIFDIYISYKICQRRQRLALKSRATMTLLTKPKKKHRRAKKTLAHEITLTLLCQSLCLLFTYFPTHLFYFLISFDLINYDRDNSTLNFILRQNLLTYLAFSPTLYVILSPTLRKEIHSYLRRIYKRYRNDRHVLSCHLHNYDHSMIQTLDPKQTTIFITNSDQLPRRILSKPITFLYLSKSAPCLHKELKYPEKNERSHTINE